MVGVRGFEPPAPASRRQCSTRLSYTPYKYLLFLMIAVHEKCVPDLSAPVDSLSRESRTMHQSPVVPQLRARSSVCNCTGRFNGVDNGIDLFQAAVFDGLRQVALSSGAILHGVDQGQGRLAFGQVVTDILVHLLVATTVVQRIVNELKRGAQVQAVDAMACSCSWACSVTRTQAGAGLEQVGGLASDDFHVACSVVSGSCTFRSCMTSPSAMRLVVRTELPSPSCCRLPPSFRRPGSRGSHPPGHWPRCPIRHWRVS